MERPSLRRIVLECVTLLFLMHLGAFILSDNELFDPDTFTHLVRLTNIISHGSLNATLLDRLSAPEGMQVHWTLPFDLFTLIVISPAAFFMSWKKALDVYGGWASPVSHVIAVFAVLWALYPVMQRLALRMVVYGTLFGGYLFAYGIFGRVDHHIFMLAFWLLWMGAVIRFAVRGHRVLSGMLAGLFGTICLWTSPETYPGVIWGIGAMMTAWSVRPGRCDRAAYSFAGSFFVFSLAALLLDPPSTGFFSTHYDRFSFHTLVLIGLTSLAWLAGIFFLGRSKKKGIRFGGMVLLHLAATGLYWLIYPQVLNPKTSLKGAEMLSHFVLEYEGVFKYSVSYSLFSAGRGLMGIAAAFILAWADRKKPWRGVLALFLLLITFYTAIAFKHRRFGIYTDVLAMVPLAILGVRFMKHLYETRPKRAAYFSTGVFLLVLFAPQLAGMAAFGVEKILITKKPEPRFGLPKGADPALIEALNKQLGGRKKSCDLKDIVPPLADPAGIGKGVWTIAADLSWTPELMYRTPHRYIAGPYHGNPEALNDVLQLMYGGTLARAHEIAKARKVDYVLSCPYAYGWFNPPEPDSFFMHLVQGKPIEWLEEVVWPSSVKTDFRLWRVKK